MSRVVRQKSRLVLLAAAILVVMAESAPAQEGARASRPPRQQPSLASETDAPTVRAGARRALRRPTPSAPTNTPSGASPAEVLVYPRNASAPLAGSGPAAVAASRVAVDIFALESSDVTAADIVLPDGRRYRAVPQEIERRDAASFLWRGRLVGDGEKGEGVITVHRGQVAGLLTLPHRLLELVPDPQGGGFTRLQELDSDRFPQCGGGLAPTKPMKPKPVATAVAGQATWIDVLVVYTPKARRAAGGRAQIEATIQGAIDVTNDAYANSGVAQRVYLVHTREVAYNETGHPMEEQLDWLRTDRSIAALRERQGADAVAMIAESPDFCGQGYVMRDVSPAFESFAFSVTHRPCAVGGRTLAHELGHNMGLEHDPPASDAAPSEASYPWSFGHFVPRNFHTVMAYFSSCGSGCNQIGHFSNPRVGYRGQATGIAGRRDNARTLGRTAPVFERFRIGLADPPEDFSVSVGVDRGALVSRAVYTLRWSAHPQAIGYHVYRTRAGGSLERISNAPVSATSYMETGPVGEVDRGYAVSAVLANDRESRRTTVLYGGEVP